MPAHPAYDLAVSYFFSEFDPLSKPRSLTKIMRDVIEVHYSAAKTLEIIDQYKNALQELLVGEFNLRYKTGRTLRYTIADPQGEGTIIAGIGHLRQSRKIHFQNLLNALTPNQFEGLAAFVLSMIGCDLAFRTPQSNDQGIDAFGYRSFLPDDSYGSDHWMVFLVQAKHYKKAQVGTKDVREFVGSVKLALHEIYSSVDKKYHLLEMKPFAPIAMRLITSEEVISSVKRLSERAGIVVYSADDLYDILWPVLRTVRPNARLAVLHDFGEMLPEGN